MKRVKVGLRPIVSRINLPTVLKTAVLPGDSVERLFIATQVGEIFYISDGIIKTFLDIRTRVLEPGVGSGYDERGLLGLAFHPNFSHNWLFYLHYSVANTQGPGAITKSSTPSPCEPKNLIDKWTNREVQYNHIDTVEEWIWQPHGQPQKRRTLLNLRRPFLNHNGVNSLNFSPETGNLVLTTGDGGGGYDPFNLSQDDMEIAGKIIEIDVSKNTFINSLPAVTRFNELPSHIQETLTIIAKGLRNTPGISFQRFNNQMIKYVGNVGQDLVESIFSFIHHQPISVPQLVQDSHLGIESDYEGLINFGWRGWEGALPTMTTSKCSGNHSLEVKEIVYYNETLKTATQRLQPLTSYFHEDFRADKFQGTALTGVQPYLGNSISDLTGNIVFIDLVQKGTPHTETRGVLAYTKPGSVCGLNNYSVIEIDYDFGSQSAYYVCLGTNLNQTRIYLGVYQSMKVADRNLGTIFEIVSSSEK